MGADIPTVTGMPASLRTSRVGRVTKPAPSISTLLQAEKSPCQPPSGMRPIVLVVAHGALSLGVVCDAEWWDGWDGMGDASSKAWWGCFTVAKPSFLGQTEAVCLLCCGVLCCAVRRAVLPGNLLNCAGKFLLSPGRIQGKPRRLVFVFVGSTGGFRVCKVAG